VPRVFGANPIVAEVPRSSIETALQAVPTGRDSFMSPFRRRPAKQPAREADEEPAEHHDDRERCEGRASSCSSETSNAPPSSPVETTALPSPSVITVDLVRSSEVTLCVRPAAPQRVGPLHHQGGNLRARRKRVFLWPPRPSSPECPSWVTTSLSKPPMTGRLCGLKRSKPARLSGVIEPASR
jgi:hypothetical protein